MNETFESIKKGLDEAIDYAEGKDIPAKVFVPKEVNVKEIRNSIGWTQNQFSAAIGISLGTLRHWERGDRHPSGPALVLLNILSKRPGIVLDALHS